MFRRRPQVSDPNLSVPPMLAICHLKISQKPASDPARFLEKIKATRRDLDTTLPATQDDASTDILMALIYDRGSPGGNHTMTISGHVKQREPA